MLAPRDLHEQRCFRKIIYIFIYLYIAHSYPYNTIRVHIIFGIQHFNSYTIIFIPFAHRSVGDNLSTTNCSFSSSEICFLKQFFILYCAFFLFIVIFVFFFSIKFLVAKNFRFFFCFKLESEIGTLNYFSSATMQGVVFFYVLNDLFHSIVSIFDFFHICISNMKQQRN